MHPVSAPIFRGVVLLTLGGLLLVRPARAQEGGRVRRIGEVLLTAGYGPCRVTWPTLGEFMDSYAAVNAAELRQAPRLRIGTAYSLGATVAGCVYLGVFESRNTAVARLASGAQRHIEARTTMAQLSIEPRAWLGRRVFVAPTFGFGVGPTRAATYFEYPDGTASWGRQRRLSGTYAGTLVAFNAGLKAGANFGPAFAQVKAEYMFSTRANAVQMYDALPGADADTLPRNYDQFLAAGSSGGTYSPMDDAVRTDLRLLRLALEVGLRLNRAD
jgi:hypothetical protein